MTEPGAATTAEAAGPVPAGTGPRSPRPGAGRVARVTGGWPAGRMVAVGIAFMTLFSLLAILIGALALTDLDSARNRVVQKLDPAAYQASQLYVALLNQETGVRGYALSTRPSFLQPYHAGLAAEQHALGQLRPALAGLPTARAELSQVIREAHDWRMSYAVPTIHQVAATGKPAVGSNLRGKADFDAIRSSMTTFQGDIAAQRRSSEAALRSAGSTLNGSFIGIAAGLLLVVILLTLGVRNAAIRPLARLADDVREIADGDFGHQLTRSGPREVRDLSLDVDSMRGRIVSELSAVQDVNATLEARTVDLQRSNSELEQFAYVASHDLQEPLRKVASFCQLLQRRYAGQLDEKADQYIEYAVDGAKRMQMLINDLLAFSRVGRVEQERVPVPAASLLAQAEANLATAIRRSRAEITAGELPTVLAEPTLLTAVFQNLLSNAIKFRGERAPRVAVTAERDGDAWVFAVADNGIGISAEYADRIFVIFQRLHDKSTYPGTGIGLAMTRKIIEYHGGRIWLDTTAASGARFRFTLPVIPDEMSAPPGDPDPPAETIASRDTEIPDPSGLPEDEEADD
ncbi:MAG TPA: ATP-binding protein [Streptosporangiaceae bacterium]|nr:ATP-binding protein [Streptosporangiaceae bacterium]